MRPRRYGSRGSTIATNEDYGKRLMGLLDSLTMFSPIKPAAESLLYGEEYPTTPFATARDRFDNLMEDPKYQGLLADAGMAGQGLPVAAPGIVIGAKAKNFPKALAEKFEKLEESGLSNREAFTETGVYRGPDGKLRYEIDDSASNYRPSYVEQFGRNADGDLVTTSQTILEHPELYQNYPGIRFTTIKENPSFIRKNMMGAYYPNTNTLELNPIRMKSESGRSTMLHELQHVLQDFEGFDKGGSSTFAFNNPKTFKIYKRILKEMRTPKSLEEYASSAWGTDKITGEIRDAYADYVKTVKKPITAELDRAAQETAAKEYYDRLGGEAEARMVQKRMDYTPAERAAQFPLDDYDVPLNELIIRTSLLD